MKKKRKSKGERLNWPKISEAGQVTLTPDMLKGNIVYMPAPPVNRTVTLHNFDVHEGQLRHNSGFLLP